MSLYGTTLRFWANPHSDAGLKRLQCDTALQSGDALSGHMKNAHGGNFDITCPACREIKAKQDALREAK